MTTAVETAKLDPAEDPAIDRRSRTFLKELNKPRPSWLHWRSCFAWEAVPTV
jgi:hypothetical protein